MFIISLSTYDFHLHYYDQDHFDVDNDANCNEHIEGTEALCGIAAVLIRMGVNEYNDKDDDDGVDMNTNTTNTNIQL